MIGIKKLWKIAGAVDGLLLYNLNASEQILNLTTFQIFKFQGFGSKGKRVLFICRKDILDAFILFTTDLI